MLKEVMINAAKKHAEAEIDLHKANIEVYMQQVVGIGEHSDVIETIQKELDKWLWHMIDLRCLTSIRNNKIC